MKQKVVIDQALYLKVPVNDLIVFAMYSIINDNKNCTFEDLVKECFRIFPKAFELAGNYKWPDARKLDRPLRTLRKRKLISGDPKSRFTLTSAGKKRALDVAKAFRQRKLL
jgi:hypothetical protein